MFERPCFNIEDRKQSRKTTDVYLGPPHAGKHTCTYSHGTHKKGKEKMKKMNLVKSVTVICILKRERNTIIH